MKILFILLLSLALQADECIKCEEAIDMAEDIESGQMEAIDDTLHFEFDEDFTNRMNTDKGIK